MRDQRLTLVKVAEENELSSMRDQRSTLVKVSEENESQGCPV